MTQRNYKEKNVQEMNMEDLINTVSDDLKRYDKLKTLEGVKKEMSVGLFSNNLSERGLKAYIRLLELELQLATTREPIFHDSRGFGEYLAGKYASLDHEEMHLISLSNKGQIISDDVVGSGTVEKSAVSIPLIIKTLCLNGAANFIVVHNHPSGSMKPSKADLTMTESIYSLSKLIKVHMLDHFILATEIISHLLSIIYWEINMKFYLTSQKYAHGNPNLTAYEIDQISKAYLGKISTVCTVEVWLPSKIKKTKCVGAGICRGGSIVINIAGVPTLQFFRKMLGKSYFMVASMQPSYPKLVIKDL